MFLYACVRRDVFPTRWWEHTGEEVKWQTVTTRGPEKKKKKMGETRKQQREEKTKKGSEKEQEEEQMSAKAAMLWRFYLRRLLGWRRGCWPAASAVVEASSRCARAVPLLPWAREPPWGRAWPSERDGFDVPGLLWDFSIVGTCVSKTIRTKLPQGPIHSLLLPIYSF